MDVPTGGKKDQAFIQSSQAFLGGGARPCRGKCNLIGWDVNREREKGRIDVSLSLQPEPIQNKLSLRRNWVIVSLPGAISPPPLIKRDEQ